MKYIILIIIGLLFGFGSIKIVQHEWHRWTNEPYQVIACMSSVGMITILALVGTYFLLEQIDKAK